MWVKNEDKYQMCVLDPSTGSAIKLLEGKNLSGSISDHNPDPDLAFPPNLTNFYIRIKTNRNATFNDIQKLAEDLSKKTAVQIKVEKQTVSELQKFGVNLKDDMTIKEAIQALRQAKNPETEAKSSLKIENADQTDHFFKNHENEFFFNYLSLIQKGMREENEQKTQEHAADAKNLYDLWMKWKNASPQTPQKTGCFPERNRAGRSGHFHRHDYGVFDARRRGKPERTHRLCRQRHEFRRLFRRGDCAAGGRNAGRCVRLSHDLFDVGGVALCVIFVVGVLHSGTNDSPTTGVIFVLG